MDRTANPGNLYQSVVHTHDGLADVVADFLSDFWIAGSFQGRLRTSCSDSPQFPAMLMIQSRKRSL